MQVQLGVIITVISLLCTIVGLLLGIFTFNRNRNKDVKKDASESASESAVIKTKLDNIITGVAAIQIDIKANEKRTSELEKQIIRVEESTKSAHKRLDQIENKGEN